MENGKNPYGSISKDPESVKIDRSEFPSNKKDDVPKIKAEVVAPKAKRTKGLKKAIFANDSTNFKSWLIYEWAIPLVKGALMDVLSRMLFDKPYISTIQTPRRGGNEYWSPPGSSRVAPRTQLRDVSHDFLFDTREEAQDVLERARDWCNRTGTMTLSDFCRIAGLTPEIGDNEYGWYNFSGGRVMAYGDSWFIDMPRVRPI